MSLRIELFPANLDRWLAFYLGVLGFTITADKRAGSPRYAAVARGGVRIGAAELGAEVDPQQRELPIGTEIVLEVDDVAGRRHACARRAGPSTSR